MASQPVAPDSRRKAVLLPGYEPLPGLMSGPVLLRIQEALSGPFDAYCAFSSAGCQAPDRVVLLPYREWWWPPSRLFNLHVALRARVLASRLSLSPHDLLVALYPFEGLKIAHALNTSLGLRHAILVHDLHRGQLEEPEIRRSIESASAVFCVSEPLLAVMRNLNPRATLAYPTPGAPLGLCPEFSTKPLGLAGGFDAKYLRIIGRFDLPVTAIGQTPEITTQANVLFVPHFASNDEAIRYVSDSCSAFCVIVPHGHGDYEMYSFPSRLLDFCRAGLPIVIVASRQSSGGKWAVANKWALYIDDENDPEQFAVVRKALASKSSWDSAREQVLAVRDREFSSETINGSMLDALVQM